MSFRPLKVGPISSKMAQYHLRENMGVNNQYIRKVRDMNPDERQELIDDFRTAANVAWNNDFNASIIGK